jgi:hypothetical protein
MCRGAGDKGREEGRCKGRIRRMNKGDGREGIGMNMCAVEWGDKGRDKDRCKGRIRRVNKGDGRE